MKLIKMNKLQSDALEAFDAAGGVVNYFLVDKEGAAECMETYRMAALLGLEGVKNQTDEYFDNLIRLPEYQHLSRSSFYEVSIYKEKIAGQEILLQEFMGNGFNLKRRKLLLRGKSSHHLNDYFWSGDEETEENAIQYRDLPQSDISGYSDAFLEPPYNLSGTHQQMNTLFWDIANSLFDGFATKSVIWSWSTDCSDYFDAGKEWWGSYFYTYSLVDSDYIVVVLASSTD